MFSAARLVLLLVLGAVLLALAAGRPFSRRLRITLAVVLVSSAIGFVNFGFFHVFYRSPIHYWDAYHYFMGAKYLPELGYAGLYEATWVAGRELGAFAPIEHMRDLRTYDLREVTSLDSAAIRARFSPARWQAFKRDLLFFGPPIPNWHELMLDHGYNDPPPRALLLHLLLRWVPASTVTLIVLTSIDYVLLAAAFWAVWQAFGPVPAAVAAAFFSLNFFARFDFIGGSIFRWDWIAALVGGAAALARGAGGAAGVLLGYAVLARVFPALFLVPLAVKALQGGGTRSVPTRCLLAVAVLLAIVGAGLVASDDTRGLVVEFAEKMRLHAQSTSLNQLGVRPTFVYETAPWLRSPDGSAYLPFDVARHTRPPEWLVPALTAGYLLAALPLIRRATLLESLMYAAPLLFCALSLSAYYYSFLVLLVLLPWTQGTVDRVRLIEMTLLVAIMALSYAFELQSPSLLPLFHKAAIAMSAFFVLWLTLEYTRLRRVAGPARKGEEDGGWRPLGYSDSNTR
jgi:hypothetical protein